MSTGCSCLKLCSVAVALSNISLGLFILVDGSILLQEYLDARDVTIGFIIVDFQMASFLIFVGLLLLIGGIIQGKEKHISLYLLLSSLIWFIITTLAVSYMVFYNTTQVIIEEIETNMTMATSTETPASTEAPKPKETVPLHKAVGFSIGLVLIWCGQLGVYKFHDQVIQKNIISAGESYVSSAIHQNES